jgi:hypothetical protein
MGSGSERLTLQWRKYHVIITRASLGRVVDFPTSRCRAAQALARLCLWVSRQSGSQRLKGYGRPWWKWKPILKRGQLVSSGAIVLGSEEWVHPTCSWCMWWPTSYARENLEQSTNYFFLQPLAGGSVWLLGARARPMKTLQRINYPSP